METMNATTTNETPQQQIWGDLDKGLASLVPTKHQGGQKIGLIKLFRSVFGTDLKTTKVFLETLSEVWTGPAPIPVPDTYREGLLADLRAERERASRFEKALKDATRDMEHYRSEAFRLSSMTSDLKNVISNLLPNVGSDVSQVPRRDF